MKKIDDGYWIYKNYDIYLAEHPKLFGKYEIYRNEEFIQRSITLSDAKEIINKKIL